MPPANDNFADAIDLTLPGGSLTFDNTGATYETGEPANAGGADGNASIWYRLTLPANGGAGYTVRVHTADTPENFDSTIEFFTGTTLTGLTNVGTWDDISYPTNVRSDTGTLTLADDQAFYIRIDAWTADTGTFGPYTTDGVLTWTATSLSSGPVPTLDDAVPSEGIAGTTVTLTGTNLTGVTSVTFGATAASFTVDSDTQITTAVPATSAPSGTVTVTSSGGSASRAFTVLFPGPWRHPADRDLTTSLTGGTANGQGKTLVTDSDFFSDTTPFSGTLGMVALIRRHARAATDTSPPLFDGSYFMLHIAVDLPQYQDTTDTTAYSVEFTADQGVWITGIIHTTGTGHGDPAPTIDVREMTSGSYTLDPTLPPVSQKPDAGWQTPGAVSTYPLTVSGDLSGFAWTPDYNAAYWIGLSSYVGGSVPAAVYDSDGNEVEQEIIYTPNFDVAFTYTPPAYRFLYTSPQVAVVEMWAHVEGAVTPGAEIWG